MTGTPRDDLARFLRDDLQEAADGREDVAYEQVEAYVDGVLDDVDREIFETRLADDPGLRAMVDDLRALRHGPAARDCGARARRAVRAARRRRAPQGSRPAARARATTLAAAGGARRGGRGGPAPVAAVDTGSDAAVAGAAAAAAQRSRGPACPCRPVPRRRR